MIPSRAGSLDRDPPRSIPRVVDIASVALDGRRRVVAFDGESKKIAKIRLVPPGIEVVELHEPRQRKTGLVFGLRDRKGQPCSRNKLSAGCKRPMIGRAAGVVTDADKGRTVTAHDLRRAFGYRWSRRVMPATLRELMRPSSIETRMSYYVGDNAKATAAEL